MSLAGELVSHWAFFSINWDYGIGHHRLESHYNHERTLARSLTLLKIIQKLSNIEQLCPILLVIAYIIP